MVDILRYLNDYYCRMYIALCVRGTQTLYPIKCYIVAPVEQLYRNNPDYIYDFVRMCNKNKSV